MKKEIFVFLLALGFLYLILLTIIAEDITGDVVTGEATSSNFGVSIHIITPPSLTIINPENETYLSNESILLNYSASSSADYVWYKLDSGSNITITSSIFINVTQGSHTLYLYANNSEGNTTKNVTFTANSSKFIIDYNEYAGSNKGSSTNFNTSTYEEIQNLSGIVLEHTIHGKITFNEAINLTNDLNSLDRLLDLDINTNISLNRIELNSTALPNFNKSATLILYGLSFSDPRILRDGSVCSSSICTKETYTSDGNLTFTVTGFTTYSAEETPVSPPSPSGGGGGGGGIVIAVSNIELDKEGISISLKQGETKQEQLTVKNIGNLKIGVALSFSGIDDLIIINEKNFDLNPGDSKTIVLDFLARENTLPDLYIGKLIISSGKTKIEVPILIEVESKESLIDLRADIPKRYSLITPGGIIAVNVEMFNLGQTGRIDVLIEYQIKDFEGNEIFKQLETVAIETKIKLTKEIEIPEDTDYGKYILYVRANYNGQIASATANFEVVRNVIADAEKIYIVFIVFLIIILSIVIYYVLKHRRQHVKRTIKKAELKDIMKRR